MDIIQIFEVNPAKVTEGDQVTVTWSCELPDSVMLSVEGCGSPTRVQLADSGTRSFYATEAGTMKFTLAVSCNGKISRQEKKVSVKAMKTIKGEKVGRERTSSRSSSFSFDEMKNRSFSWFGSIWQKIKGFFLRLAYGWAAMPEKKRRIWKFVVYLCIAMWLASFFQNLGYKFGYEKGIRDAQRIEGVA